MLLVNDTARVAGRFFETDRGTHRVVVLHPDFPIYRQRIQVDREVVARTVDLRRQFAQADTLAVQLAMNPYSADYQLEVTMNGRPTTYAEFPVLDLKYLAGDWQIKIDIINTSDNTGSSPRVDSCVTYPYGGGSRQVVTGARGTISLLPNEAGNVLPLLVFWSE